MRVVDRKAFLNMPAGTLFAKYDPCVFQELRIKVGNCGADDFFYSNIVDAIDSYESGQFGALLEESRETGASVAMDFDAISRDGCFDDDQLFGIFEPEDLLKLIAKLTSIAGDLP